MIVIGTKQLSKLKQHLGERVVRVRNLGTCRFVGESSKVWGLPAHQVRSVDYDWDIECEKCGSIAEARGSNWSKLQFMGLGTTIVGKQRGGAGLPGNGSARTRKFKRNKV